MTLARVSMMLHGKAVLNGLSVSYPVIGMRDVDILFAVGCSCGNVGSCTYLGVIEQCQRLQKAFHSSDLFARLSKLCLVGLIDRRLYGRRLRYALTVQGENMLNDLERGLAALEVS